MMTLRALLLQVLIMALMLPLLAGKPFSFVQLADPQFGMGDKGYTADVATFKRAVQLINALKPNFVVINGDLINNWTPDSAKELAGCMKKFTMPVYVAPGNHDGWGTPEYSALFGPDHQMVKLKQATLIILNTNLWDAKNTAGGDAQMTWLNQALKEAAKRKKPILLAGHCPLFLKSADEKDEYFNTPTARRSAILELCKAYKIPAYLCGHTHYSAVSEFNGTIMAINGSTAKNISQDPLGFRLWHVDKHNKFTNEYVAVTDEGN